MNRLIQNIPAVVAICVVFATAPTLLAFQADPSAASPVVQATQQTREQLQRLVAPIALYPDALVAQILAAATYPDQLVEADRWMQQHPGLKGDQLAQQVDQQPWDPSVKALTELPSVLANMDKNLSWTSSLGDAEINQQQDLMSAIQTLRQGARHAGNLKSGSQQTVSEQGQTIVIAPTDPDVVYVPQYDPWSVYGPPIVAWPGWYGYPGLFIDGPGVGFGLGFGVGFFGGFGWGWHHWDSDWHHHTVIYNHNTYVSRSRTFINRNYYTNRAHDLGNRAGALQDGGFHGGAFHEAPRTPHDVPGNHPGTSSGIQHGGITRGSGFGGRSGFGGGGLHGGSHAGGFHGGGGHGGGHR